TNVSKLIKTGGKSILLGVACWLGIIIVSLTMQAILGTW
ncbi:putative sulfate exporter family transporter, partial [Streptococcus agalactiae]|nr:putative sulfate exporter family transporter [Streptococcus agalactiae]